MNIRIAPTFSERLRLDAEFRVWARTHHAKETPFNVIAWLSFNHDIVPHLPEGDIIPDIIVTTPEYRQSISCIKGKTDPTECGDCCCIGKECWNEAHIEERRE